MKIIARQGFQRRWVLLPVMAASMIVDGVAMLFSKDKQTSSLNVICEQTQVQQKKW